MPKLPIYVILYFSIKIYLKIPYNQFLLVAALKPRMNTAKYIYIFMYMFFKYIIIH